MQPAADPSEEQQHIPAPRTAERGTAEVVAPEAAAAEAAAGATRTEEDGLTEREREILAFEARWWKHAGAKEQAIRDSFGVSSTRYYQLLNGLLDKPAAAEHDPLLVGRLRRLRATRARTRRR
jgi:hypothetical protein